MELTAQKEMETGEKGPAIVLKLWTYVCMAYRGASAMRATDPRRDPSSPIALMYQSHFKTHASRLVLCVV